MTSTVAASARLWSKEVLPQFTGILQFEFRRQLFTLWSFFVFLLAMAPVLLLGARAIVILAGIDDLDSDLHTSFGQLSSLYAVIYRTFFLRLAIFLGCALIFMHLFRGEILEKTLHYYFLCPVRREVLVAGKFVAGVLLTAFLFGAGTIISYLLLFVPAGWHAVEDYIVRGPGLGHLATYLGVTVFACLGYGAAFLLIGLLFKNWIIPAAIVLGWESMNYLLPPLLKKFSVIYYLESLCPVPIPFKLIALLANPAPAYVSVPGFLILTALILFLAGLRVRKIEITYTQD